MKLESNCFSKNSADRKRPAVIREPKVPCRYERCDENE
jgi:hypothetical protein